SSVSQSSSAAERCARAAAPTPYGPPPFHPGPAGSGPAGPVPVGPVPVGPIVMEAMVNALHRVETALAGADPHHLIDRGDPDLAVTDLPGTGGGHDRVDHLGGVDLVDDHLDPDLRQELHCVLGAPVDLGVT